MDMIPNTIEGLCALREIGGRRVAAMPIIGWKEASLYAPFMPITLDGVCLESTPVMQADGSVWDDGEYFENLGDWKARKRFM